MVRVMVVVCVLSLPVVSMWVCCGGDEVAALESPGVAVCLAKLASQQVKCERKYASGDIRKWRYWAESVPMSQNHSSNHLEFHVCVQLKK